MRNMNCRNIQREIEEVSPGDLLSSAVNNHLLECAACETFAREQNSLQRIVASLGTVEAPGDFDFRLRARLAAEKQQTARPFSLVGLSFGARSYAMALLLVLVGGAILFVALKSRTGETVPAEVARGPQVVQPASPVSGAVAVNSQSNPDVKPTADPSADEAIVKAAGRRPVKRNGTGSSLLAGSRRGQETLTMSGRGAPVYRSDQLADAYPTSAFPINASYQSLKVSVDDGRGSKRTISLPTVSFGSQRTLSQSNAPLVASARGAW
jgi:hypothetical protein